MVFIIQGKIMKHILGFLLAISCLSGCGTIYSPTLNLPHEPLTKNQGQLTGTLGVLPQEGLGDLGAAGSGEGQISYAFSDRFSLQAKAWSQLSELYQFNYNGGTSIAGTYLISPKDASLPLALIASSSMLIDGRSIKANGGSLQLAAWLPKFGIFRPYVGLGTGMMVANFKTQDWGYGVIMNAGTSIKFSANLHINFEVFGILQRYIKYQTISGFLAPSLSMSWRFDNSGSGLD
jgi:hypothetical protein